MLNALAGQFHGMAQAEASHPISNLKALNGGDVAGHEFQGMRYVEIPDEHWSGSVKEMRQRAGQTMRGFKPAIHPKLGPVQFSKTGRLKTLSDKTTPHQFQSVQAIPQLIEQGDLKSSMPDSKGRAHIVAVHTVEHGLKIGEDRYHAKIIVREVKTGGGKSSKTQHQFYLHQIADNKKAGSLNSGLPQSGQSRSPASQGKSTT
jgi:hypothetical protein